MNEKSTMYKKDEIYSFTVNPSDAGQFFRGNSIHRIRDAINYNVKHFNNILVDYSDITLYPEISRQGRIHYHGYIRINDVFNFHVNTLHKLKDKYIYEIDTIKDSDIWSKYILKDKSIMEPALRALGLPYKMTNKIIKKIIYNSHTNDNCEYDIIEAFKSASE